MVQAVATEVDRAVLPVLVISDKWMTEFELDWIVGPAVPSMLSGRSPRLWQVPISPTFLVGSGGALKRWFLSRPMPRIF